MNYRFEDLPIDNFEQYKSILIKRIASHIPNSIFKRVKIHMLMHVTVQGEKHFWRLL